MDAYTLCYHSLDSEESSVDVCSKAELSIVVSVKSFRQQLQCLAELGLPIESLERQISIGTSPDKQCVILTFDDGHRSNYTLAMPALLEVGAKATFYVVAGFVDNDSEYMTAQQVRELADNGMLIGSHTMTHRWLPQLSRDEILRELVDSKAKLEDMIGRPILDFALPGGHGTEQIFDLVRECGYRSVATCKVGVYCGGSDPFQIPRLEIRRGLTIAAFRNTFDRRTVRKLQILEGFKSGLRKSLGLSMYGRLRRFAHTVLTLNR